MAQTLHFVCFKGFMGDAEAWAGSMSSLTQLVCTPHLAHHGLLDRGASAANMAQHFVHQTPLAHKARRPVYIA
jgi:hypothetical protein